MQFKNISEQDKKKYNKLVSHPLQSWEWGEFREKTGVGVVRRGGYEGGKIIKGFTLTLHNIPKTPYKIGYLPKGNLPSREVLVELYKIGRENKCVFIQIEPNIIRHTIQDSRFKNENEKEIKQFEELVKKGEFNVHKSFHPLFTKYNFVLDISRSESDLLASFHAKTRYNIRVAGKKHGVRVVFDSGREAFADYLKLLEETTSRQAFYAHTPEYHRKLYEALVGDKVKKKTKDGLFYHIARALYTDSSGKEHTLAAWVLFSFGDTLYYPYGASSNLYRFTMSSNLICWEAIRYGKNLGLKKFDMWGALGPEADKNDSWYGFHRFKTGYSPAHVEYVGSFDVVTNPWLYNVYKIADRARWAYLGVRKRF